jgi:hypothetical protein
VKQLLTILFLGLSTLNAQVIADTALHTFGKIYPDTPIVRNYNDGFGVIDSAGKLIPYSSLVYPHYDLQQIFDTVKVKIMYEQGDAIVPMFIKGWQVIQLNKWMPGDPIFHKAYGYHEQPDKWEDVGIFLFEDKRTRIDTTRKWGYKKVQW